MNLAKFLFNADADEPTAGIRGAVALACAGTAPFFLDWRTMLLPLLVAVFGGVSVALSCWSTASRQLP